MLKNSLYFDYVIIGAGIMGLSIARQLLSKDSKYKIAILEKESQFGMHASGRNSGVLHSGIYYNEASLKAKFCLKGARELTAYCNEHQLPINKIGKIILPTAENDFEVLNMLHKRAQNNGATVQLIDGKELKDIEPEASTLINRALYSPETSVVDPMAILKNLSTELVNKQVQIFYNQHVSKIDIKNTRIDIDGMKISYGHLFNTAGLHADRIAAACGLQDRYLMIPFKGIYYELAPNSNLNLNHLIYPVPDLNVPFLGIHFTKSIHGTIYVGPTAIPALGREHYYGMQGAKLKESLETLLQLGYQYVLNKQGFRTFVHQEVNRFAKQYFTQSAQKLVPKIQVTDLKKSKKVGIRAQLFDLEKRELVMDFLVKKTDNETHVLNAVSPGFTSAFSFARYVVQGDLRDIF